MWDSPTPGVLSRLPSTFSIVWSSAVVPRGRGPKGRHRLKTTTTYPDLCGGDGTGEKVDTVEIGLLLNLFE